MSSGNNSPASGSAADHMKGGNGEGGNSVSAMWSEDEVEAIKRELREFGRNWNVVSSKLCNKTAEQCKKFFYDNRKKCGLDKIILEFKRVSAKMSGCCRQGAAVHLYKRPYFGDLPAAVAPWLADSADSSLPRCSWRCSVSCIRKSNRLKLSTYSLRKAVLSRICSTLVSNRRIRSG